MKKANNNVENGMNEEDSNHPGNKSAEMIHKETKNQVGKEVQKVKKSLRENYSADAKTKY